MVAIIGMRRPLEPERHPEPTDPHLTELSSANTSEHFAGVGAQVTFGQWLKYHHRPHQLREGLLQALLRRTGAAANG